MRVNLMKSSEFRHQGAVSGAFALRVTIFAVILYGAVFGALGFVRYEIARRDVIVAREIWKIREPLYNNVQAVKHDLAEIKKVEQELDGWKAARVSWSEKLLAVQMVVPSAVQLRRLSIRGDQELVKEKGMSTAVGIPARRYLIDIDGKIVSEDANVYVNKFIKGIEIASSYSNLLQTLTLQELKRGPRTDTGSPEWFFSIQAVSKRQMFQP